MTFELKLEDGAEPGWAGLGRIWAEGTAGTRVRGGKELAQGGRAYGGEPREPSAFSSERQPRRVLSPSPFSLGQHMVPQGLQEDTGLWSASTGSTAHDWEGMLQGTIVFSCLFGFQDWIFHVLSEERDQSPNITLNR